MSEIAIELNYYWLPVIGFVVGLIATMVGGNGAFFFPPALILLFQISPKVAIATSLAAVIPIGLIGSAEHYRQGNINLPVGIVFGAAGMIGAFLGAWMSSMLKTETLVISFSVYLILLGLFTLYRPKARTDGVVKPPEHFSDLNKRNLTLILSIGFIAGCVTGLYGTSGTAPVIAAMLILRLPLMQVVGTSVLIVFINAFTGFSGHVILGELDFQLILLLGSGATVGAFLGPRLLGRIRPRNKENKIRMILGLLLIVVGIFLLTLY